MAPRTKRKTNLGSQVITKIVKWPVLADPTLGYARGYSTSRRNAVPRPPIYDLGKLAQLEDVESYVMMANIRKTGLFLKAGYNVVGRDQARVDFVKQRFNEIEICMNKSFDELVAMTASELVKKSTAYWVAVRTRDPGPSGKPYVLHRRRYDPIIGYFLVPAEVMCVATDEEGHPIAYQERMADGRTSAVWNPEDIKVFTFNKKAGLNIGTPILVPVEGDIRTLRQIEEHVELMLYQYLFPLYHAKVGTEDHPPELFEDGTDEVDLIRSKLQTVPIEGGLVTSHRVELDAIGAEGRAVRAEGYLTHFKQRVLSGQGVSGIDLGEPTGNRSSADAMAKVAVDLIKFMQQCFADQFKFQIIGELLHEGGWFDRGADRDVSIKFGEIDIDYMLKKGNYISLQYQGNVITEDEARVELGREILPDSERPKMFLNLVTIPMANAQTEAKMELLTSKGAAQNANMPRNQHGRKLGPEKRKSSLGPGLTDAVQEAFGEMQLWLQSGQTVRDLLIIINTASSFAKTRLRSIVDANWGLGLAIGGASEEIILNRHPAAKQRLYNRIEMDVGHLFIDIGREVRYIARTRTPTLQELKDISSRLQYRARLIDQVLSRLSLNYGKALGWQLAGFKKAISIPTPDSADISRIISLEDDPFDRLPPFHPNCRCEIEPYS